MEHAITIGDILKWGLGIGVGVLVLGVICYFLAAFGRGMSR
jgi:hypothetical protein